MSKQLEIFSDIVQRVAENVGLQPSNTTHQTLAQGWVNRAYLDFNGKFAWPWLRDRYSLNTVLNETTGTVTVTNGSRTVTGSGTAFSSDHVGRMFLLRSRADKQYRIISVTSATELVLEQPYNETTEIGETYIIWKKYYTLASEINNLEDLFINERKLFWSHIKEWDDKAKGAALSNDIRMWALWGWNYSARSITTGTVTVQLNTRSVTGSATTFLTSGVHPGDKITFTGTETYHIKSIESETQLTLVELATATRTALTFRIVSEQAPTIVVNASSQTTSEILSYTYKRRTYPMQNDQEVPNIDRQFWDSLVIGGMAYGYEFLDDQRQPSQLALFDKSIKEAWAFYNSDEQPEAMEWSVDASRSAPNSIRSVGDY